MVNAKMQQEVDAILGQSNAAKSPNDGEAKAQKATKCLDLAANNEPLAEAGINEILNQIRESKKGVESGAKSATGTGAAKADKPIQAAEGQGGNSDYSYGMGQ
jgi:hypothetical protein